MLIATNKTYLIISHLIWGLRQIEEGVLRKKLWDRRFEKDIMSKTLWERRCEKDVPSTDSNLISYVFQISTVVKVAEDLISFTDLLTILLTICYVYNLVNYFVGNQECPMNDFFINLLRILITSAVSHLLNNQAACHERTDVDEQVCAATNPSCEKYERKTCSYDINVMQIGA